MKTRFTVLLAASALCLALAACGTAQPEKTPAAQPDTGTASPEASAPVQTGEQTIYLPPVLRRQGGFTGTEQLKAEDGWRGGYYYADRTGDGRTEIINCCFESTRTSDETQEAYAGRCAAELSGAETAGFTAEKNAGHTERIAYPVYVLSWQTGQGGGARHWDALFFQTDTHTYMYAFNTEAAQAQEMHDTWMAAFSQLELTDR